MNPKILNTDVQAFISKHLKSDISKLLLKGIHLEDIDDKELIEQIEAKNKCEKKLPSWYNTDKIYYPNKLNIEQTSSEITAKYKSTLISGNSLIDLTGGFGVDCFYFSKTFETVIHCEMNQHLSTIVNYNYKVLQINNIQTVSKDGLRYLDTHHFFDWIYIDPSRRHDIKGKVFFLKDCIPNIPEALDTLLNHSKNILIKTSPLLDITAGINELRFVKSVHIVAVNNEVKELLWILEKHFEGPVTLYTANIKPHITEYFEFTFGSEADYNHINFSEPLTYLYQPNAAILKAGAFNTIARKLNVSKLHKHSHLYTSIDLINFPGRSFKIEKVLPFHKKCLKSENITQANITTRNFPKSVEELRKLLKIKNGGRKYLFFTTSILNEKIVIITTKV